MTAYLKLADYPLIAEAVLGATLPPPDASSTMRFGRSLHAGCSPVGGESAAWE